MRIIFIHLTSWIFTKMIFIFILLLTTNLFAHQPKLINYSPSVDNPHEVIFPEISKAYYGKLSGEPHYYIIKILYHYL